MRRRHVVSVLLGLVTALAVDAAQPPGWVVFVVVPAAIAVTLGTIDGARWLLWRDAARKVRISGRGRDDAR